MWTPLALAAPEAKSTPRAIASTPAAIPTVLFPLRSLGVPANEATALETTLRNEAASLPELTIIQPGDVAAIVERAHESDCLARPACAADAASKAGAKQFVSGTVSALGEDVLVDLKLVDARTGKEVRRITHPVAGRQELVIQVLHAAAVELLAPARFVGRLEVRLVQTSAGNGPPVPVAQSDARGAHLFVDGKLVADLPLAHSVDGIEPGRRAVRVTKEGFHDASLFVEVRFDQTTKADVDLPHGELAGVAYLRATESAAPVPVVTAPVAATLVQPERGPWLRIAGWSALGAGVIAVGIATAMQLEVNADASTLNLYLAGTPNPNTAQQMLTNKENEVRNTRIVFGISGALALAGAAMLISDVVLSRKQSAELNAAPVVVPGGGAVALSGEF